MNLTRAAYIIEKIRQWGVLDYCLCAGARNSPFITLIDENRDEIEKQGKIFNFFDERSAGFFALGRSQSTQRPTVIITTSGTAATELTSSVVEAFYSQTPLIVITADRPPSFRKSGAPQSIEQLGIYSHYCHPTIDLFQDLSLLDNFHWSKRIPLHLNVCFDEPLLSEVIPRLMVSSDSFLSDNKRNDIFNLLEIENQSKSGEIESINFEDLSFFKQCKKPLFIFSGLKKIEQEYVIREIQRLGNAAIGSWWVETLSGLRGHPLIEEGRIKSSDHFLQYCFKENVFDGVIRIGSVPTLRLWRDLEEKLKSVPVLNLTDSPWTGLSRPSEKVSLSRLSIIIKRFPNLFKKQEEIHLKDQLVEQKKNALFDRFPKSEMSLVRTLSNNVGEQPLYLGNSLPIREWDFSAKSILLQATSGNRGANGIDGQLSTFFGWKNTQSHSWALVGDLTALYDLNAPWIVPQLEPGSWTIAIMNNSGGHIFKPMFGREVFLNRHNINFENWAKMWGLTYQKTETLELDFSTLPQVLEIIPCEQQTHNLNQELEILWKTL